MNVEERKLEILQSVMNIESETLLLKLETFLKNHTQSHRLTANQEMELEKSRLEIENGQSKSFDKVISKYL